ncbi:hypothetical protein Tco_0825847, partial [Tanacetum coccineum]
MFIKYSDGLISLKKTISKGSQCKKAVVSLKLASVEVSDESDSEPAIKQTSSRRVITKKVSISAKDNIILEPDATLKLAKSISLAEAAEEEAANTSSVSKKMSHDPSQKLKGVQTLTLEEQLATDTMQAVKASRKSNRSQALTRGPSEGTSVSPRVSNKSTVIPATSSEGTGTKPGVLDEEKKDDDDDDKGIDIEETDDEETDDEFVRDDVDKEIKDAEVAESGNGDEEIFDTAKADAKMTKKVKDDNKKAKLPTSSSSLFVSSGFDTIEIQSPSILTVPVLVISEPAFLLPIPKIPIVTSTTTLPPPHYVSTISPILEQTTTQIPTPPITIEAPPITTVAPDVTTILDPLPVISQRVFVLEKNVQELKAVDHTTTLLTLLRSEIPSAVNAYLGSILGDALQKVLQKHTEELIQQYPQPVSYKDVTEESVQANVITEVKNLLPLFLPKAVYDFATLVIQSTIKKVLEKTPTTLAQSSLQAQSSLKAAESLSDYELKNILFEKMDKIRSYLTHDKHQALYDSLFNSLCPDDVIARSQVDPEKIRRKKDRDDEDPSARPNQVDLDELVTVLKSA